MNFRTSPGSTYVCNSAAGIATSSWAQRMHNYVDATGHSPVPPRSVAGFWQSKDKYASQAQVLNVSSELLTRGLPVSMMVVDWGNW